MDLHAKFQLPRTFLKNHFFKNLEPYTRSFPIKSGVLGEWWNSLIDPKVSRDHGKTIG